MPVRLNRSRFNLTGKALTAAHVVGATSLVVLAVALVAVYVGTAIFALYLNVFVGVVQSFQKFAYLNRFAPTGSEPPFAAVQLLVLVLFIIAGIATVRRYHPTP